MLTRRAAQLFALLASIVAVFQLALIAGAPWGHLTWGGRYPGVLPPGMRGVAAVSLLLMLAFAWIVLARAGFRVPFIRSRMRGATWGVVAYCALGVVANAATPSRSERALWLPVVSGMLLSSVFVARSAGATVAELKEY